MRRTVFSEFEEIEIQARLQAVRERLHDRVDEAAAASRKDLEDRAEASQAKKRALLAEAGTYTGSEHGTGGVEWRKAGAERLS